MQNKSGRAHLGKQVEHIDVAEFFIELDGILGRGGLLLEFVEPAQLLKGRFGHVQIREDLAEGRVLPSPPDSCESLQRLVSLGFIGRDLSSFPAHSICAVENEMAYLFRVADRVVDRDAAPLRDAQQGEAIHPDRIHDGFQIIHPGIEGKIVDLPIGESAATLVVSDERVASGHLPKPVTPHGAGPVELKMG